MILKNSRLGFITNIFTESTTFTSISNLYIIIFKLEIYTKKSVSIQVNFHNIFKIYKKKIYQLLF